MIYAAFACSLSLAVCDPIDPQVTLTSTDQCRTYIDAVDTKEYNTRGRIVICLWREGNGAWQKLPGTETVFEDFLSCLYRNAPCNLVETWIDKDHVKLKYGPTSPCWSDYFKIAALFDEKETINIWCGLTTLALLACNPNKPQNTWLKQCGENSVVGSGGGLPPQQHQMSDESSAVGSGKSSTHAQMCAETQKVYTNCLNAVQSSLNAAIAQARATGSDDYDIRIMERANSPEAACAGWATAMYDLPPEKWTPNYANSASACSGVI